MKKIVSVILVNVFSLIFVSYVFASDSYPDLNRLPEYSSKIELDENTKGNCSHLAEEIFYQVYGIKLHLQDKKTQSWLSLKNNVFYDNSGKKMIIRLTEVKLENSLMLLIGEKESHIAFIYKIFDSNRYILTIEGNTKEIGIDRKIEYGDSWYFKDSYSTDSLKHWKHVYYIYAEGVKE